MIGKNILLPLCFLVSSAFLTSCGQGVQDVGQGYVTRALHAPWDGLEDNTRFCCHSTADRFFFSFEVEDGTLTLSDSFDTERAVDFEDRVEIFFCPAGGMKKGYHCAEIDALGRVMDYSAEYYRDFDFDWNFSTLEVRSSLTPWGYRVAGSVSRDELRELGLNLENGFRMGVCGQAVHVPVEVQRAEPCGRARTRLDHERDADRDVCDGDLSAAEERDRDVR